MSSFFDFRLDDLNDPQAVSDRISGKNSSNLLKTTHSKNSYSGDPRDVTLFSLSQILLGVPGLERPEDILRMVMARTFSGIASIADLFSDFGLGGLIPSSISDTISALNPFGRSGRSGFSITDEEGNIPAYPGNYTAEERNSALKVISDAKNEVGYSEAPPGSNNNKFASKAGVPNGEPWSMTFLMALFIRNEMPQGNLLTPSVIGSLSSMTQANRAGSDPIIGAIGFQRVGSSTVNHCGIVIRYDKDTVTLIEGSATLTDNDNDLMSANFVAEKVRPRGKILKYGYPIYSSQKPITDVATGEGFQPGKIAGRFDADAVSGSIFQRSYAWHPAESATVDSRGPRPGATALMNELLARFPGTKTLGIYNFRQIRGGSSLSVHSEGRALDVGVSVTPEGKRIGDNVFALIAPAAWSLGIQRVVWYRRIWQKSAPSGREYGGTHPHTDHLHIELTRSAATNLTRDQIQAIFAAHKSGATAGPSAFENTAI